MEEIVVSVFLEFGVSHPPLLVEDDRHRKLPLLRPAKPAVCLLEVLKEIQPYLLSICRRPCRRQEDDFSTDLLGPGRWGP